MDFIDQVRGLAEKALDLKDRLQTEEATKNALVMPFLSLLGYDVFNPAEVLPEFTADIGTKKGERVDYAIMRNGVPIILIECKAYGRSLDSDGSSQLYRYFTAVDAPFGLMTNGLIYRFYTDLDKPNRMDLKPFLELDLLDIREPMVEELKKFTKPAFDVDTILATATELKYTTEIRRILGEEFGQPTAEFVRFFTSRVYAGVKTQAVIDQFTNITRRALQQFVNDRVNERLRSALRVDVPTTPTPAPDNTDTSPPANTTEKAAEDRIITSEIEIHAYYIVKAILGETIDVRRIAMRDRISYCGILLDDNNRKPICRLYFDAAQKYLGLFNGAREEERVPIEEAGDIFKYAERLRATAALYDSQKNAGTTGEGGEGE